MTYIPNSDFLIDVRKGIIPNHDIVNKYGYNGTVNKGTEEDVWSVGGNYAGFLTSATTVDIDSTSTSDDVGSTGAEEVTIQGLDGNFDALSETIALDGTTTVTTTGSFIRVFRMFIGTVGATGTNVGTITAVPNGGGVTLAEIPPLEGQTQMAIYTVPSGKTAIVLSANIGMNSTISGAAGVRAGQFKFWYRLWDSGTAYKGWRLQRRWNVRSDGTGNAANLVHLGMLCPEKTDFKVTVDVQTNGTSCYAEFGMIIYTP